MSVELTKESHVFAKIKGVKLFTGWNYRFLPVKSFTPLILVKTERFNYLNYRFHPYYPIRINRGIPNGFYGLCVFRHFWSGVNLVQNTACIGIVHYKKFLKCDFCSSLTLLIFWYRLRKRLRDQIWGIFSGLAFRCFSPPQYLLNFNRNIFCHWSILVFQNSNFIPVHKY